MRPLQDERVRRALDAVWVLVLTAVFLADRLVKLLLHDQPERALGPLVSLRPTANPGLAFSLPAPNSVTTLAIGIVLAFLLAVTIDRWRRGHPWLGWAFLVVGGASNFLDRLRYGAVIDYLRLGPLPVFNLADAAIAIGLGLLLIRPLTGRRSAG